MLFRKAKDQPVNAPAEDYVLSIQEAHALGSPTLLAQPIASTISNLSIIARLGLRGSSFVLENLLEAARLSTHTSLAFSRRAILSAIASAQTHHEESSALTTIPHQDKAYVQAVESWTQDLSRAVDNTLSLAELFIATGFSITACLTTNAFSAAEESVRLLDGLFGSNDTSRAIASIVCEATSPIRSFLTSASRLL